MGNNITKNQHYVPQFYLRQFVDNNNKLYCYNKSSSKKFIAHPSDICFEKYLYEVKTEFGEKEFLLPNDIEKMFCSLEGEYDTNLKCVVKKCLLNSSGKSLICTLKEKEVLASMVSNFIVRNLWAVNNCVLDEEVDSLFETNEEVRSMDKVLRKMKMGGVKPFLELAQKRLMVTPNEDGVAQYLIDELLKMDLSFVVSKNVNFVTSDCPVSYNCSEDELFMARIPLSPQVTAIYSLGDLSKKIRNRAEKLPRKLVEKLNVDCLDWDVSQTIIAQSQKDIDSILHRQILNK